MAGSVNKVILVGNLGRDPEIRSMQNGGRVANFSLACSETWKDKNSGERKEKTEWVNVAVFNDGLVDVIDKYVHKGDKLYVEGKLQTRKWTDQSGQERYSTEVVLQNYGGQITMLSSKGGDRGSDVGEETARPARSRPDDDLDDSIPFATCDPEMEPYLKRAIVA